ncbi:hypothetical protein EJB05_51859, partial [Eragrostis curvula]
MIGALHPKWIYPPNDANRVSQQASWHDDEDNGRMRVLKRQCRSATRIDVPQIDNDQYCQVS